MNKKKLVVAIAYAICASVSSATMADVFDVDINTGSTNAQIDIPVTPEGITAFIGDGANANLSTYDIINAWNQGNAVYISATTSGTGATTESGVINIDTVLDLDATIDSSLHFIADGDININNTISDLSVADPSAITTTDKLNLNFSSTNGVVSISSAIEGSGNVIGFNSIVNINGTLDIGNGGAYAVWHDGDSLEVDSVTLSSTSTAGDSLLFRQGSLTIHDEVNINSSGYLRDGLTSWSEFDFGYFNLGANVFGNEHNLRTASLVVGDDVDADSGTFVQFGGSNIVDGTLTIKTGGTYNMGVEETSGGILTAGSIVNTGLFNMEDGDITSGSIVNSGYFIQLDGSNTVSGELNIQSGGSYDMSGGNLTAGSIVNDGAFIYSNGGVRLTASDMIIANGELLGAAININTGEAFGAVNQNIGVDSNNTGSVLHSGGTNTVDLALTINDGSAYVQTGGTNTVNTLNINEGAGYQLTGGALSANTTNNTGVMTVADVMTVAATDVYNLLTGSTAEDETLNGGALSSNSMVVDGEVNQQAGSTNSVTTDLTVTDTGRYIQTGGETTTASVNTSATGQYDISGGELTAGVINNAGLINQSGSAVLNTNSMTVDGGSYVITGGDLTTNSMTIGNVDPDTGSVTQSAGNATVRNMLTINDGGSYALSGGSLMAGDITRTAAGVFDYTGGDLTIKNGTLAIQEDGLLGADVTIAAGQNLSSASQIIGIDATPASGTLTQTGGTNTVVGALTVTDGGTYNMQGGNLRASNIVNNGAFNYTSGGVLLTANSMNVNSTGLLGSALVIDAGEVFGATSMTIGDGLSDHGSVEQNGGSNTVVNALTVNDGSSYILNDGDLNVGSLLVNNQASFTGVGTVNSAGDITDLRTSGSIDTTYIGTNINLSTVVMDGNINASESIALNGTTVTGVVTGTAMSLSGGASLVNDVNLQPYVLGNVYNYSVINSVSGDNSISGNVSITPLAVNRVLSKEIVDSASIDVSAGSLAITGNIDAAEMDMSLNVASGASLSLANTTASSIAANGLGNFVVDGVVTTGQAGTPGNVTIDASELLVGGANGAIHTNGGAIIVGTDDRNNNTANLTIDNTVAANSDRIGDNTDIRLSTGSRLTINGHATDAVTENAGSLIVDYLDYSYLNSSYRDFVANVDMNAAGGSTQVTFDGLQIVAPTSGYYSGAGRVNRVDFSTNGVFGGSERILFNSAPVLTDGLMSNATINGQEFATYDNAVGIQAATTATNNFVLGGNIFVNADTNLSSSTSVNSLAVATANVTGAGTLNLSSGQMLLSGTSIIDPAINFGAQQGQVLVTGDGTLTGGVNGTNGMFVNGGGRLELAGAGSLTGLVTINSGELVLSADNAIQGSDVRIYDAFNIEDTIQNVNSLTIANSATSNVIGTGTVIAENNISHTRTVGTLDASYQSLNGNVTVYEDVMNGDVVAADTATLGRYYSTSNYIIMNGNVSATNINAYGTFNGSLNASNQINLYSGTVDGVISGAANLNGYGTLTNINTYTGSTDGIFTLRENGSIASSSEITGSLSMYSNDGEANVDRVGDLAQINLNSSSDSLSLIGAGTEVTGLDIVEDVGVINVSAGSEVNITIENSLNGSATLTADALNLGADSLAFLSLGNDSRLMLDSAPSTIEATAIVDGVYLEKDINGASMPTWTTYDSSNGVVELIANELSLTDAAADQFIRVTDAVNSDLVDDAVIAGLNIDTTQAMTGAGTLSIGTGQVLFWKDNTISIAELAFGNEQAFLANAGSNVIESVISGSNGLRKLGDGTITLSGNNTYTGETRVSSGSLVRIGDLNDTRIDSGADLTIVNGTLTNVTSNQGRINLENSSLSQAMTGGTISVDSNSSLSNFSGGNISTVYNYGSSSNGGGISRLHNEVGASFTNTGYISNLYNDGSFINSSSQSDIYVARNYVGASLSNSGSIDYLYNSGTVNNSGTIYGVESNYGDFVNTGTVDSYIENSIGSFVNNGTVDVYRLQVSGGTFTNNSTLNLTNSTSNSETYSSHVHGELINSRDGVITLENSNLDVTGAVNNSGTVEVMANSSITGTGSYIQSGNKDALTTMNGRIETDMAINSGILKGSGYIVGDLVVGPNGTVQPGNSPGLLTIDGDFTLENGAELVMEIWGDGDNGYLFDEISVTGDFNLFGDINFDLGEGLDISIFETNDPEVDPLFSFADFFLDESGVSLSLAVLAETNVKVASDLGELFAVSFNVDDNGDVLTSIVEVSAVPVPAAVWLFGSGLIGLAGVARRRKAA